MGKKKKKKAYLKELEGKKKKKKKHKKKEEVQEIHGILDEIESYRIYLYEKDKKQKKRKEKKALEREEKEFIHKMGDARARIELADEWEKTGFLEKVKELLEELSPILKMLATAVCKLILAFLSVESIQRIIRPETLNKILTIYHLAVMV